MPPLLIDALGPEDRALFQAAWETARKNMGKDFTFYLPGMVRLGRERGRYPAISITGRSCQLLCEHCKGRLLEPMIEARDPEEMMVKGLRLKRSGALGLLLSGGADPQGRLPWEKYCDAIGKLKEETDLFLSAHVGFPERETCRRLRQAGIEQALIDVMGDEETARRIYHLGGLRQVRTALQDISLSGLSIVPHIVAGLSYGKMKGEEKALEALCGFRPSALVFVVLTPLKGTPMARVTPPSPLEVARLVARARLLFPDIPVSLGCERPRNRQGLLLEKLAILAGADRMALWSEEAVAEAENRGLSPRFQPTCCSVAFREDWRSG